MSDVNLLERLRGRKVVNYEHSTLNFIRRVPNVGTLDMLILMRLRDTDKQNISTLHFVYVRSCFFF